MNNTEITKTLLEIKENLGELNSKIDNIKKQDDELKDHEERLKKLEKDDGTFKWNFKAMWTCVVAFACVISPIVTSWIESLLRR